MSAAPSTRCNMVRIVSPMAVLLARSQRIVPALVVECAGDRREHIAEFAGVGGKLVGVVGSLVGPKLHDGEMVGAVLLVHHVEAQVAAILAAALGEILERGI